MQAVFNEFAEEAASLGGSQLTEFNRQPTELEYVELVGRNKPAVFRSAFKDFVDASKSIINLMADSQVTISSTPNGEADAILDDAFMLPHESIHSFPNALELITSSLTPHYIQSQNNNLESDFSPLCSLFPPSMPFIHAIPDARNIWIGNALSTTVLHKDHYENVYICVRGVKIVTLIPPTDYGLLDEKVYPIKRWLSTNGVWSTLDEAGSTPWVTIPPGAPINAITVTLQAGDGLYIPSLWFHALEQETSKEDSFELCIAINYWYDMDYSDSRYAYFQLVKRLRESIKCIQ